MKHVYFFEIFCKWRPTITHCHRRCWLVKYTGGSVWSVHGGQCDRFTRTGRALYTGAPKGTGACMSRPERSHACMLACIVWHSPACSTSPRTRSSHHCCTGIHNLLSLFHCRIAEPCRPSGLRRWPLMDRCLGGIASSIDVDNLPGIRTVW